MMSNNKQRNAVRARKPAPLLSLQKKKRPSFAKKLRKAARPVMKKLFQSEDVENFFTGSLHPFAPGLLHISNTADSQPSHPYTSTTRSLRTLESGEYLIIGISPCLAGNMPSLLSWVGTSAQLTDTFGGSVSAGSHETSSWNSPYNLADFDIGKEGSISGRLVSAGVEVKYAGTEYNRGGNVYFVEDDDHRNMVNGTTTFSEIVDLVTARQTVRRGTFNECATYQFPVGPVNNQEDTFASDSAWPVTAYYPYAPGQNTVNGVVVGSPIAFIVVKPAGPAIIDLTCIAHYEFIGKASVPLYRTVYAHPEETFMAKSAIREAKQQHHKSPTTHLLQLGTKLLGTELKKRAAGNKGDFLASALKDTETVAKVGMTLAGLFI